MLENNPQIPRFGHYCEEVVKILPTEEQDRLRDGLVKYCYHDLDPTRNCRLNHDGLYTPIDHWGLYDNYQEVDPHTKRRQFVMISQMKDQDRWNERLVRIEYDKPGFLFTTDITEYVPLTEIKFLTKQGSCFIATRVYGNPNADEVRTLRKFRDEVLAQSGIGRAFIDFYYSGAGRGAARILAEQTPSLIRPVRLGLDALVYFLEKKDRE